MTVSDRRLTLGLCLLCLVVGIWIGWALAI